MVLTNALTAFMTHAKIEGCVNLRDIDMIKERRAALITEGLSLRVDRSQLPIEELLDNHALSNPRQKPTIIAGWLELN